MLKVVVNNNGKDIIFSDAFYNDDKKVEFRTVTSLDKLFSYKKLRYVYNASNKKIEVIGLAKKVFIKINKPSIRKIESFERVIIRKLNEFYQNIISDKEKILAMKLDIVGFYDYYVTTPTMMNNMQWSSKYGDGLLYCFSNSMLGDDINLNLETMSDLQVYLSVLISEMFPGNTSQCIDINYSDIVEAIKKKEMIKAAL